jgi:ParB/RepB/Spo0J family partition protein
MVTFSLHLIEDSVLRQDHGERIGELVTSLSTYGQFSPIRVRKHPTKRGLYQVIFGHRRLSAARKLGWATIDAELVEASDSEALAMAFAENECRKDFSDFEKGLILAKMHKDLSMSYEEIAKQIHRSVSFVSQHIAMTHLFDDLPPTEERKEALLSLTEKHARILAKIPDPSKRWETAKLVVAAKLCEREVHRFVHSPRRRTRTNSPEEKIRLMISNIFLGLNRQDTQPLTDIRSKEYFNCFDDFPPFGRMNRGQTIDHSVAVLRVFRQTFDVEDLDVKVWGNCALATMYVLNNMQLCDKRERFRSRLTMVFVKEAPPDVWKIVHEHWSSGEPSFYEQILEKEPLLLQMSS